jgi:hypothetical protein
MELRIILARIFYSFDLVPTDGAWKWNPEGEMKHMKVFTTWEKPELNLTL